MKRRRNVVPSATRRRRTSQIWIVVAAVVLVINGVTVTTLLSGGAERSGPQGVAGVYADTRLSEAIDIAEEQVLGVVSLDSSSGNAELTTLSDRATADFRTDFDDFVNAFLNEVRADGLEVRSRIVESGISSVEGDRATVLVVTSGDAIQAGQDTRTARTFQMKVETAWIGGAWRIDGLEFV